MIHVALNPYRQRAMRYLELFPCGDWRLKLYGISALSEQVPAVLAENAKEFIAGMLPKRAVTEDRYGVGFAIVHEGRDGNYILVSWWQGENMLCHHVFGASLETPLDFISLTDTGIVACVWELDIIYFERNAWIATALSDQAGLRGDAVERYLTLSFPG